MWLKSSSREESNRKRRKRRKTGLLSSWQRPQRPLGEQKITRKRAELSRTEQNGEEKTTKAKEHKEHKNCGHMSNALSVACIACHRRKHITDIHRSSQTQTWRFQCTQAMHVRNIFNQGTSWNQHGVANLSNLH